MSLVLNYVNLDPDSHLKKPDQDSTVKALERNKSDEGFRGSGLQRRITGTLLLKVPSKRVDRASKLMHVITSPSDATVCRFAEASIFLSVAVISIFVDV